MKQLGILIVLLLAMSCKQGQNSSAVSNNNNTSESILEGAIAVATPITYEVIIKNLDTTDVWKEECLEQLEREKLMNLIFQQVYNGELTALNYFTNDTVTASNLRAIEAERATLKDDITKLQFTENWYYDSIAHKMHKQIKTLTFGYPKLSPDSVLVYKPVFKIMFD